MTAEAKSTGLLAAFDLGQVVASAAVRDTFSVEDVAACLVRHSACDWGDLSDEDKRRNGIAVKTGSRILSSYEFPGDQQLWIFTEAENEHGQRPCTTILLPSDY